MVPVFSVWKMAWIQLKSWENFNELPLKATKTGLRVIGAR
jgi:hypothetical protein